jgi:hypothetical protein
MYNIKRGGTGLKVKYDPWPRRRFLKASGYAAAAVSGGGLLSESLHAEIINNKSTVPVSCHLWGYASKHPTDWDCTPIPGQVLAILNTPDWKAWR